MAYLEQTSGANFSVAQAITTTTTSTNVFDVTGAGVGNAPAMTGTNGANTAIGVDIGAGQGMAEAYVLVNINTTGTGTGTVTISIEAAPDNGSYAEGTYYTVLATDAYVGTTLIAGQSFALPVPPIPPAAALPRFYRLAYTVSGTAAVTLSANLLINAPNYHDAVLYGNNIPSPSVN